MNILGLALIIIPIVLLLICSFKYRERFATVFTRNRNIDYGKADPRKVATAPVHAIPFQVEQFDNGNDEQLKYSMPRNIDYGKSNPRRVATAPTHVIEGFSVSNLTNIFNKPNNDLKLNKASANNTLPNNAVGPLEKQYQSMLENGKSNEQVNAEIGQQALSSNGHSVPMINSSIQGKGPQIPEKQDFQIKAMKCQFFPDSCPTGWSENGSFSINGMSQDVSLSCGDASNFINCEAIAEVKNKKVSRILVTEKGGGYLPDQPPQVDIISTNGMGTGAKAECIVDDNGRIQLIKVTDGGNNYIETPTVQINNPNMNRKCNLCCKN